MTTATMPNIDITPHDWSVVKQILLMYVPYYDVWAFGSRATWTAKAYSDLDLAVITDIRFSLANMAHLQAAFEESDLSIKVDVVDWTATSDAFRKIIRKTAVVIQKAQKKGDGVRPGNMMMTDYGAFAVDYTVERLASLCVPDGGVQTGPFGSQLHQEDYVVVGTPIITVEHLGNNRINHQDLPRISDRDRDRLLKYHLNAGDIVFSRVGSVDRRALVRGEEDGWLFSGRCLRIRPDNTKISSQYLSYFFGHPAFKEHIRSIAVGATMPSLNTQLLSGIFIPYPKDLKEQRAIASILGTLDDKIELNRRMNETLEAMVRDIFKDWFVDFGPTRAKMERLEPYLAADLWALFPERLDDEGKPEGWRVGRVGNVAELNPESWSARNAPPKIEYVDLANTKWGAIEKTEFYQWNEAPSRARRILRVGDTIIGTVRPGNGSYAFIGTNNLTGSTGFAVLRPKQSNLRELVYCAVTSSENIERLAHLADGGAYPAIRPEVAADTTLLRGSKLLDEAFSILCGSMIDCIEANKQENQTLAQTRDLLLPKLLSGEIRVKDVDKMMEEIS